MKNILFNPLLNLSNVNRYSGIYLAKPESTSDHTTQVGLMAIMLGNEINKRCYDSNATHYDSSYMSDGPEIIQVDISTIALKALVHDIDEASSADIPRNIKYSSGDMSLLFKKMEKESVARVTSDFDFPQLYNAWESSKDSSLAGRIIKCCDLLTVVRKTVEEVEILGNKNMLTVAFDVYSTCIEERDKISLDKTLNPVVLSVFVDLYDAAIPILYTIIEKHSSDLSDDYFDSKK